MVVDGAGTVISAVENGHESFHRLFAHKRKGQSTGSKKRTAGKHDHGIQHGKRGVGNNRNNKRGNSNQKNRIPPNPNKR